MPRTFVNKPKQVRKPRPPYKITSNDDRMQIIAAYEDGEDSAEWQRTAINLNINIETARSIINKWKKTGQTKAETRKGRTHVITGRKADLVLALCAEKPTATLEYYQDALEREFPDDDPPSLSTINNFLDGKYVTLMKQVTPLPAMTNSEEVIEERKEFALWFEEANLQKNLVSFDEFSFHSLSKRSRGSNFQGERDVLRLPCARTQTLNIVIAMSRQFGVMNWRFKKGIKTAQWIIDFIKETSELYKDQPLCYVGNNSNVHDFEKIEKAIECYGHTVHALPRYSPQLNPVENAINVLKCEIKKELEQEQEEIEATKDAPQGTKQSKRMEILQQAAEHALESLTEDHVQRFHDNSASYIQMAKRGQEFE
ncbi:hypothetical protein C9374_007612 [Naegleria lovaniensis]|uniref:Tc1-like transposase DDE domain-containing protein n=1 Tax=Naegleria lovaniensis TaxID=51637 RepID=A0AA88KLJ2_NAELO|nr:uncharacterized protein C9374_007612 [Naegleria lovaniensis]KAG2378974.1 hypothetical protein C9374_007612 [Naegleria lovaniensis]